MTQGRRGREGLLVRVGDTQEKERKRAQETATSSARRDDNKGSEANKTRKRAQRRRDDEVTVNDKSNDTENEYDKSKDEARESDARWARDDEGSTSETKRGQESANNGKVTEMKINDVRQRRGGGSNNDARQ